MRDAPGYSIITSPGERALEHDLYTCAHCNAITFTKSGLGRLQVAIIMRDGTTQMRDAGFCRNCFRHVCPRCDGKECVPFEKKIDLEEKAARAPASA
jgi:hypothetical protein